MTEIRLHNTKTRRKEVFTPIDPDNVRMYVCGPTVYDRAHLGNARPVIVFDVLYRLLRHVYGPDHVTYVRNFTDVDDKINARAAETGRSIGDITAETTQWFLDDMAAVGALEPSIKNDPDHQKAMPRATQYIPQMVDMINGLIAKGFAYSRPISYGHNSRAVYFDSKKAPEHAFFDVQSYENYGQLSGRTLEEMISGERSELGEGKKNPLDFVLWKPSRSDEPGWESPWGIGRPGWHIECSAMSKALLGDTFDIHGGGLDLMFPHHENEIAQSCCANGTDEMARYWLHNEMLQVEGKKMSKSLGNFFTVRDLLDQGVPGEVIRFVMLSTHYRKPMDWTEKKREEAARTLRKWRAQLDGVEAGSRPPDVKVIEAIADDLNTSAAIARLHELSSEAELETLFASLRLLGLGDGWEDGLYRDVEAFVMLGSFKTNLAEARETAMQTKDFTEVDRLKTALLDAGVEVRMSKDGVDLVPGPNFDPAKLEGLL